LIFIDTSFFDDRGGDRLPGRTQAVRLGDMAPVEPLARCVADPLPGAERITFQESCHEITQVHGRPPTGLRRRIES
jgi:hypothetical protein